MKSIVVVLTPRRWLPALLNIGLLLAAGVPVAHADTDIATYPLFTTSTSVVKPNLLFVLDDSGSMDSDYLPDDAQYSIASSSGSGQYGRRAAQCNGVGYSPVPTDNPSKAVSYDPPMHADGTSQGPAPTDFLNGADPRNGTSGQRNVSSPTSLNVVGSGMLNLTINASSKKSSWYSVGGIVTVFSSSTSSGNTYMVGTVNSWDSSSGAISIKVALSAGSGTLSNVMIGSGAPVLQYYYTYTGSQAPMGYVYSTDGLNTSSTFYKECSSNVGSTPGAGVFTLVFVTSSSSDVQRYANWYAYYRTRMQMMKTATSRAFSVMDDKYRIGFTTISDKGVNEGDTFLNVRDFNATQKTNFYSKLMAISPGSNTPLRGALSKAGRYFAKKVSGQTYDPVQYSCQKNFTILSTDGYWNADDEVKGSTTGQNYGPYGLDNVTEVGEQDGFGVLRPQFDGNSSTTTTSKETWSVTSKYDKTTVTPQTSTTTSDVVTTTIKPFQSQTRKTYSLTITSFTNSSITPSCSKVSGKYNCTMTVKTSSNHGYANGQSITISGADGPYNGSYTIALKDNNEYSFTLNGLATAPAAPDNDGTSAVTGVACAVGKGMQYEQVQTRIQSHVTTSTARTSTSMFQTKTQVVHYTDVTPYTRTVVVTNGVQKSNNTVAGTMNSTPVTDPASIVNGNSTTTNSIISGTSPDVDTGWVNSGSATLLSNCVSTASATTAASNVNLTSGTSSVGNPVQGGPTVTAGPGGAMQSTTTPVNNTSDSVTKTTGTVIGGSLNSLADVAMYYYQTPLRSDALKNCTGDLGATISLCDPDQPVIGFNEDTAKYQHMSTYTLSLGNSGTLKYDPDYLRQQTGSYVDLRTGNVNWPVPGDGAGAVNIDDLWHAAVNGRGLYFSASDPGTLASSLNATLTTLQSTAGSASAAATSTLQPVEGDNGVFIAQFMSSAWTGDLRAYAMNVQTGDVAISDLDTSGHKLDLAIWSAGDMLTASTVRTIYYFRPSGPTGVHTGSLQPFVYDAGKMTTDERAFFDNACDKAVPLSQCTGSSDTAKASLNSGANMVSFLRGQPQPQYRIPAKTLGDIVNSSPVYVGKPVMKYSENNYAAFKTTWAGRKPTVYVGANDGMLHAFNAEVDIDTSTKVAKAKTGISGTERWAYIPRLVMPNLYKLADSHYDSKHQYFVDATPVVSDIYDTSAGRWRTILVAGLNAGGRGYYALDVTDPTAPIALWEFSDDNLGYTFGNPVITKNKDGKWIVAFTSGYNNPDGGGHLFVVDAVTGASVLTIDTGVGTPGASSGLNKLNAWIDSDTENLAKRFYAGDLLGNVWRFDIDGLVEPKNAALSIAQLTDASENHNPQPITTTPQLAQVDANGGSWPVVFVGTGRYLGKTDVGDISQQSLYAIKDGLTGSGIGNARSVGAKLVKQEVSSDSPRIIGSPETPVNWSSQNGWYVDLLLPGERINVDMQQAFGNLTAAANIPARTATDCTEAGQGKAWLYKVNIQTGRGTSSEVTSMVAGLSSVQLPSGDGVVIVTKTDATKPTSDGNSKDAQPGKAARRSSWRELAN